MISHPAPAAPGRGGARIAAEGASRASRTATFTGREPVEALDRIKKLLETAEDDIRKAEGGNKAAGTRARQSMQQIKTAAQEVRQAILGMRGAADQGQPAAGPGKNP